MSSNPGLTPKPEPASTSAEPASDAPTNDAAEPKPPAYAANASDFKFAVADAVRTDDVPDPVFSWDRDVFTSALNEVFDHAPAVPDPEPTREPAQSPIRGGRVDLSALADALKEGLR